MAAVPTNLIISASEFGSELDISWELPIGGLPKDSKTFVFKRTGSEPTIDEIDSYFQNINDLTNFPYRGLFVFDQLNYGIDFIVDYRVINGLAYHYKVIIRDSDGNYSPHDLCYAIGVPNSLLQVNVKDGKEIVATAIEKMFENVVDKNGNHVKLNKDIKIIKKFAAEQIDSNYVMIERVNGSNFQQFWGNQYGAGNGGKFLGDYDVDVIRATYMNWESSDRRDIITNIFRASKYFLTRAIKSLGATDVKITIEGDYYNPMLHGVDAVGTSVIFNIVILNQAFLSEDQIDSIVSTFRIIE
jgi:putative transposon-encoded protein